MASPLPRTLDVARSLASTLAQQGDRKSVV